MFGGELKSEDPYSVDIAYLKYLFGLGPAHWCPRFENHYMFQMTSRIEVEILSNSVGDALVAIVPLSCIQGGALRS